MEVFYLAAQALFGKRPNNYFVGIITPNFYMLSKNIFTGLMKLPLMTCKIILLDLSYMREAKKFDCCIVMFYLTSFFFIFFYLLHYFIEFVP